MRTLARFVFPLLIIAASDNALAASVLDCETRSGKPGPTPAEAAAISKLSPLRTCNAAIDDRTACNVFLGRALYVLFGNSDFKTGSDTYMLANDIVNGLEMPGNAGWKKVGVATQQDALTKAQTLANEGKAVVAARKGPVVGGVRRPGHVALILPGTAQNYAFDGFSWGGLIAPNSASFFLDNPDRMFFGCPLSAVWKKPDDVGLFYKP